MTISPRKIAVVLLVLINAARADADADADAWQNTALGLFSDAHRQFSTSVKERQDRESRLGQALTLLQLQPRTDARLREAAGMLDDLLAETTTDEVGANARYFRARLEQIHRNPSDLAAAGWHYKKLREEHPSHPLAGQALVKLAILNIYRAENEEARRNLFTHYAEQAALLPVEDPSSRRDMHLVLAEAALRLKLGDQPAIDHFLAALERGVESTALRADLLVRIGELASALHDKELARRYYQLFLDEFPRDSRRRLVAEHQAALDSQASLPTTAASPL